MLLAQWLQTTLLFLLVGRRLIQVLRVGETSADIEIAAVFIPPNLFSVVRVKSHCVLDAFCNPICCFQRLL